MFKEIQIPAVLNPASIEGLNAQLRDAELQQVRFVVLHGSDGLFCNGLDLAWVANSENDDHFADMQQYGAFLKQLQAGKFISIAVINGTVAGGGMGVVCACDHVIATEKSTFALTEGLLGLIPGMILPSLLNRMSPQQVKKMVFTGRRYSAAEAMQWLIVDELAVPQDLEPSVNAAINSMRSCKPGAVSDIKESLYNSHISKDELAQLGMKILNSRLKEEEIRQRLKDIADLL